MHHPDQASAGSTASPQGGGSPLHLASHAARGALQDPPSAAIHGSSSRLPQAGHPLPQGQPPQLDPSILARMVTAQAQGPGAAGLTPFRVASMQEFRRSRNSLNTVHEASQQPRPMAGPNQAFALNMNRPSVPSGAGPRASENPLLKMMEARMAAKSAGASTSVTSAASQPALPTIAQSPSPPPVVGAENTAALQASSKWAGMGDAASIAAAGAEKQPLDKPPVHSPQVAATGSPSGRAPLSAKQIDLLKELTASQDVNGGAPPAVQQPTQPTEKELLFQMLLSQAGGTSVSPTAGAQAPIMGRLPPSLLPVRNNAQPGLTRCAVSLAEVDRLRRANQAIQFQQQVAMQQRALQKQRTEQAQLNERNIAANALLSMQNNGAQTQVAANIGGQLVTQDMLNQIQANALNRIKTSSGELPQTFRKRRSVREPFDDEDDTSCSASSHTHSITSSASSHKIHRSLSHSSARAALSGSMENLRIRSHAHLLHSGSRNQSFSSGSFAGGVTNMQNQSFGSSSTSSQAALQRSSSQAALRRSSSSNGWIQSILSKQRSAGKAAEVFEQVLTQASPNLASTSPEKSVSPVHEEAKAVSPKPIQVQAEEYSAPPIERPASTSGETVIVSAIPDRIKYQNAEPDTKPIEVLKQALQDRGEKCAIKPTVDVADDFFTKVTEMYDQEVVSAIRASDVDALRRLHEAGTTLQCGNRFGETLIHLACRRSHRDVVSFLVNEVGVSLRVRDDYGRTPMHDACWRAEPDLELLDLLLDRAPELLMLSDKRGHSPLDYGRREHWAVLVPFLRERKAKFRPVP